MDRFRFTQTPFTREIKVDHRFKVPFLETEISTLKGIVDQRMSAALVAPAGVGKTVIIRALDNLLARARHRVCYIKLTEISMRDMCRQLATYMGAAPSGTFPALVRNIEQKLQSGFDDEGLRQIIIFDDAHEMRPEVVKIVRLLTNFEMDSRLLVSVILAGHPSLKQLLMRPDMEDTRQRLSHSGELRLLTRDESKGYLEHRVTIAGAPRFPFDDQAVEALYEMTRGNMRALDKLALATLKRADEVKSDICDHVHVADARASQWM